MAKTMTTWGAMTKLEAIAEYADRAQLPGRREIGERVFKILFRESLTKEQLVGDVKAFRAEAGAYAPRTAQWLDARLFELLDYMDAPEIQLTGAQLLDQLVTA
jgi:hypothetical protein